MATVSTLPANATKAQALAALKADYGQIVYHNAAKTPYEGKNYLGIYNYIESHNPSASPHDIAVATADLLLSSGLAGVIGTGVTAGGNAIGSIATGVETANYLPNPVSSVADFLGKLSQGNTWLRVAEVLLGLMLITAGVGTMTGHPVDVKNIAKMVK